MSTANDTSDLTENPPESMRQIGFGLRHALHGSLLRKSDRSENGVDGRLVTWRERDDWVAICVKMGLNAREIVNLSYSWPQPITTTQQAYDKIEQLNLKKRYKRGQDKLRAGDHNRNIIYVFSKLTGQSIEYGLDVWDVMRDVCPDGGRFRPDLLMTIGDRRFYVEVQLSKIEGTRWSHKFRNYLKLYEYTKQPFRALFLVDKREDVAKLKRGARFVLSERKGLNLFLFMTLDQFHANTDVIKGQVWQPVWGPGLVALH